MAVIWRTLTDHTTALSTASIASTISTGEMSLLHDLRNTPYSYTGAIAWTTLQVLSLGIVYGIIFSRGDAFLRDVLGVEVAQTPLELRWFLFIGIASRITSQVVWALSILTYNFPVSMALVLSAYELLLDSLAIMTVVHQRSTFNLMYDGPVLLLVLGGIVSERIGEFQRKWFKADSKNAGKPYMGGVFSTVVYPNYAGYTAWRTALTLFARSPLLTLGIASFVLYTFISGDVENQRKRNSLKYGEVFDTYYAKTAKMFPFVY